MDKLAASCLCAPKVEHIGDDPHESFFVVPNAKRLYAVEVKLLRFITDELQFSGSTFSAVVKVWAGQHPEVLQQTAIHGERMDKTNHTRDYVAKAWYVWQAFRLLGASALKLRFDLRPDTFDKSLQSVLAPIRLEQIRISAAHVQECDVCKRGCFAIGDGKQGAGRWICCGTEGCQKFDDLEVSIQTGCTNHVGGGNHLCNKCRPSKIEPVGLIPQTHVIRAVGWYTQLSLGVVCMFK